MLNKLFIFLQLLNLICGLIIGDYDSKEEGFEPRPIEGDEDLINYVEYLLNRKSLENFEEILQLKFPDKNESSPDTVNSCGCAKSTFDGAPNTNSKIVGGQVVHPNSVPYQVLVYNWRGKKMCGGVILNQRYVLTAMHCVYDNLDSPLNFFVMAGLHDICPSNTMPFQKKTIKSFKYPADHPYTNTTILNDIVLLELTAPFVFGPTVQPACLPKNTTYLNITERIGYVSGWGKTSDNGSISCLLRYVDQKAWSDKDCLDSMTGYLYEQYANFSLPTSIMMCGGFPEGGKSTCHGDSGGPFVLVNPEGRVEVIGLVSWGFKCDAIGMPSVYTKVQFYVDWIKENIQSGECSCTPSPCQLPDPAGSNPASTTITTTTATTTTTTTSQNATTVAPVVITCESAWYKDKYCDESNNKPECNYDMGDCCDRVVPDWNYYCRTCECCQPGHPNYTCTASTSGASSVTTTLNPAVTSTTTASSATTTKSAPGSTLSSATTKPSPTVTTSAVTSTTQTIKTTTKTTTRPSTTTTTTTTVPSTTTTTTTTKTPATTSSICNANWYNDLYCDDINNRPECQYDKGDCCNRSVQDWNLYCTACECCQPGHANYSCTATTTVKTTTPLPASTTTTKFENVTRAEPMLGCILNYVNDGYCDDENNKACCNYDSGDCCDHKRLDWDRFCVQCKCKTP